MAQAAQDPQHGSLPPRPLPCCYRATGRLDLLRAWQAQAREAVPWRGGKTRIWRLSHHGVDYYAKAFYNGTVRDALRHRLRTALRIYRDAEAFQAAGVPVAAPLFAGLGSPRLLPTGCLGLAAVPGPSLAQYLAEAPDPEARRRAVLAIAEAWGGLTRAGGFHADPAPRNFILEAGDPERPRLIDLESLYRVSYVSPLAQAHRLRKFLLSAARRTARQGSGYLDPELVPAFIDAWRQAAGLDAEPWQRPLARRTAIEVARYAAEARGACPQGREPT